VTLWSVVARANKHLLDRENQKPKPLGPGLRRDDERAGVSIYWTTAFALQQRKRFKTKGAWHIACEPHHNFIRMSGIMSR
jgi:hypothetical protein